MGEKHVLRHAVMSIILTHNSLDLGVGKVLLRLVHGYTLYERRLGVSTPTEVTYSTTPLANDAEVLPDLPSAGTHSTAYEIEKLGVLGSRPFVQLPPIFEIIPEPLVDFTPEDVGERLFVLSISLARASWTNVVWTRSSGFPIQLWCLDTHSWMILDKGNMPSSLFV